MRQLALRIAGVVCLLLALEGCSWIAPGPTGMINSGRMAVALSNAELDKITAGADAFAAGAGEAVGSASRSVVLVITTVGIGSPRNAVAAGRITSNASSPRRDASATATSALFLSIAIP